MPLKIEKQGEDVVLYRIFDTAAQSYWMTPNGKHVWEEPSHAKNAWNCACGWGGRGKFGDQPNLEIHKYIMVREIDIT